MITPQHPDRTEQIFFLLKSTNGWRSGEEISKYLGISRAAVAKRVQSLRDKGHVIASASRRGYKLLFSEEAIDPIMIKKNLHTTFFGRADWHIFYQTTSTSNEAISLALKNAKEGTIVVAEKQTAGRGIKGKNWFSAPRSMQASLILRPELTEKALAQVTLAGTMALVDAIKETTDIDTTIKIPNDIFLGDKKVAGLLTETGLRAGAIDWLVLGFGCNVNTLPEEFPEEFSSIATSLYAQTQKHISRNLLLASMLNWMEYWYKKLDDDLIFIEMEWQRRVK